MYCQYCGNPDQKEDSYCRSCGEFLNSPTALSAFNFGGLTPKQNVNTISFLSLFAALLTVFAGVWMYLTQFNIPIVLYFAAAILICSSAWHFSTFLISRKLTKKLREKSDNTFGADETKLLNGQNKTNVLGESKFEDYIPNSIVERTTKKLKVDR